MFLHYSVNLLAGIANQIEVQKSTTMSFPRGPATEGILL
jgi:hypothetical protein